MYRLFRPFFGSYTVCLSGENILPFVHTLASEHILFWDLDKNDDAWTLKTTLSHAEPMLAQAAQAGIHAELIDACGLPFLLARYKKRVGLLVGVLLGMALLFVGELFVWQVTVEGNTVLTDAQIIEALEEYGIGVGSYIPHISVLESQNEFLLRFDELSSFAINIKGTHVQIEVLERTHTPEIEQTDGFCNIVADCDGIVLSVEAVDGTAIVKTGDVVSQGQILISAYTVASRNIYRLHHARGSVLAQVYGTFSQVVPLVQDVKHYTGKTQTKTSVRVFGKSFDLFWSEDCDYDYFDAEVKTEPIVLFGIVKTPLTKTQVLYREYTRETVNVDRAQAEKRAKAALDAFLAKQTDTVADCTYQTEYDEIQNACILQANITYHKQIGIDRLLMQGEQPPAQVKPPVPK